MPTPSDDTLSLSSAAIDPHAQRPTCPPENERVPSWRPSNGSGVVDDAADDNTAAGMALAQEQSMFAADPENTVGDSPQSDRNPTTKMMAKEEEDIQMDSMTPESIITDMKENEVAMSPAPTSPSPPTSSTSSYNYEFSNVRVGPLSSLSLFHPPS